MKKQLWQFFGQEGSFKSTAAHTVNSLYFPVCNSSIMSSVTPYLRGDCKCGQNSFLLEPVSRIDLSQLKSSRNFWIYINKNKIWSAAGVSKDIPAMQHNTVTIEAGLLWHCVTRANKKIGLQAAILSFAPASKEPVEIMLVTITNISSKTIRCTPLAAIPLYARSADNRRDHRHVTSLLHRISVHPQGIAVTPTLLFDETGHSKNTTTYFVFGADPQGKNPQAIFPIQEEFSGIGSDLEMPDAVYHNAKPNRYANIQGKEAMAGLRFAAITLKPKESAIYTVVMGIVNDANQITAITNKFNSSESIHDSFEQTKKYWLSISETIGIKTGDDKRDNWFRWVSIQPTLRKIFGNSFLPDFDYGKGGRGWRDLWQDCLALILSHPSDARSLLINNYSGVRIDGSNATIIGKNPGEYIADRNNISRVWMDHGVWPLITTQLYIHQTGDIGILNAETSYFRDHHLSRCREIDRQWTSKYGKKLRSKNKNIYAGSVLEHILVQHLVQFFNVGAHNHIRLENADWNDGLDMAYQHGESVAFTAMYAHNLRIIAELTIKLTGETVSLLKETTFLLDTFSHQPIDYNDRLAKQIFLNRYFASVKGEVSGERTVVPIEKLASDLIAKAEWITGHIRKTEWLNEGWYNGYYNNDQQQVEGTVQGNVRMTLTGQVFPILSGIATEEQITRIYTNAKKYLRDSRHAGFRLNTDFGAQQLNLGRAFSFSYGDKENGAFFNHMSVMFAYALYARGCIREGYEVLNSIYDMAVNTPVSKIYPCLPEYFNNEGRGMYSYLTGSASWYIVTLLTRVFGIRGEYGDLMIEPNLTKEQFKNSADLSVSVAFAQRDLVITFHNPYKKDFSAYTIKKASLNDTLLPVESHTKRCSIPRQTLLKIASRRQNTIVLTLG